MILSFQFYSIPSCFIISTISHSVTCSFEQLYMYIWELLYKPTAVCGREKGTLYYMRQNFGMVNVKSSVKKNYKAAESLMLSVTKANLCSAFMVWSGMKSLEDKPTKISIPAKYAPLEEYLFLLLLSKKEIVPRGWLIYVGHLFQSPVAKNFTPLREVRFIFQNRFFLKENICKNKNIVLNPKKPGKRRKRCNNLIQMNFYTKILVCTFTY